VSLNYLLKKKILESHFKHSNCEGSRLRAAFLAHLLQSGIQQNREDVRQSDVRHQNRPRASFWRIRGPSAGSGVKITSGDIASFRQVRLVLSGNTAPVSRFPINRWLTNPFRLFDAPGCSATTLTITTVFSTCSLALTISRRWATWTCGIWLNKPSELNVSIIFILFNWRLPWRLTWRLNLFSFLNYCSYYESYCGMVNGSFGEAFAPRRNRTSVTMYLTDICR